MKTAIAIFTSNAVKWGIWNEVLDAVDRQAFQPDERIVVDSESDDRTVPIAIEHGWTIRRICRKDFDYGSTRNDIVRELQTRGFDAVVFLSQDVVLHSTDALGKLVEYLLDNDVAGCYGRQIDTRQHSLGAWQRERSYPEVSRIKTLADVPHLKLMTPFFSNAFSAWRIAAVTDLGGFPCTMFGEDMLFAAKVLNTGGAVGYCSDAVAVHEHPETMRSLFLRGWKIGVFHRLHPELLRQFGTPGRPSFGGGFLFFLPRFLVKSLGYVCGRFRERLVPWFVFALLWMFLLPALLLYDFPQKDVAFRYAPMAEAFAAGEWRFAFHPRVPPLMPACAGLISFLFSCNGALACRLAGALFMSCGVFPLYWGIRRMYGSRTAVAAALMYAGCTSLFRLGFYGLREPACAFGLLLLFYSAVRLRMRSSGWWWYPVFAAAEAILLMTRGDQAPFVLATMLMLLFWDVRRHCHPLRTAGVVAVLLALVLPMLVYNYYMIGYPVPDVRHGVAMRTLCRHFRWMRVLENPHPQLPLDIGLPEEKESDE